MPNILIVEDDEKIRRSIKRHLVREKFEIREAANGKSGLEMLDNFQADLILLDVMMPVMNGYEMCKQLKSNPNFQDIFVLMISAKAKPEERKFGFDIGADDYLTKPFDPAELLIRVRQGLDTSKAWKQGARDQDTGLFNRSYFNRQLAREIAHINRVPASLSIALITFNILGDQNNKLEIPEVKKVKKEIGKILVSQSRFTDTCAMWNKLEYIVLLRSTSLNGARLFGEKILEKIASYDFQQQNEMLISVGVAELLNTDADMIRNASLALQKSRQSGRNCVMSC